MASQNDDIALADEPVAAEDDAIEADSVVTDEVTAVDAEPEQADDTERQEEEQPRQDESAVAASDESAGNESEERLTWELTDEQIETIARVAANDALDGRDATQTGDIWNDEQRLSLAVEAIRQYDGITADRLDKLLTAADSGDDAQEAEESEPLAVTLTDEQWQYVQRSVTFSTTMLFLVLLLVGIVSGLQLYTQLVRGWRK